MPTLSSELRRTLETTCVKARTLAEQGSREALTSLAVGEQEPFSSMTEEERQLRERLQAHGHQLGDVVDAQNGTQGVGRLVRKMAYEHWHRMLFARFLAENNLLIEAEHQVSVSLAECEELAQECGTDPWELAASYAQAMLPQIFRVDDPVLAVKLPLEIRQKLQRLVTNLEAEIFAASDSLGWVYQFWQTEEKERVNKSEVKIGAEELPVVTQLFTEPYMVSFLLDNALGAWWAIRRLSAADLQNANSEKELRQQAAIPGVPLDYLRFVQQDNGNWAPAAGTFADWPQQLADLKILDPCCGSGHFLVAAFLMLVPMRMELESLSPHAAVDAVLRENIHGLEIDQRCVEIAVFALALAAWRFPGESAGQPLGLRPEMPVPQVACCGLSVSVTAEQWISLVPKDAPNHERLQQGLRCLHATFAQAPLLGSLLSPEVDYRENILQASYVDIEKFLEKALELQSSDSIKRRISEDQENILAAQGLLKAARICSESYHLVVTNVPYLGCKRQNDSLRKFCKAQYADAKGDLANVFLERCLALSKTDGSGTVQIVMPQNWLTLKTYRKQRKSLLRRVQWSLLARLGSGAFASSGAEPILLTLAKIPVIDSFQIVWVDVSVRESASKKAMQLCNSELVAVNQKEQMRNPDSRIVRAKLNDSSPLSDFASARAGYSVGDSVRFERYIWEQQSQNKDWEYLQSTVKVTDPFGGRSTAVFWESETGQMQALAQSVRHLNHVAQNWLRGKPNWGKLGISVSLMGSLPVTIYTGEIYDTNCSAIIPKTRGLLAPLWAFCSSSEFNCEVRKLDQSLKLTNHTLLKVPFDLERWRNAADSRYPNGLPKPYTDDPTQWLFHGHPKPAEHPLQVAVARLLGYRWPAETDAEMELADQAHEWISQGQELCHFADEDGIVCLSPIRGERSAAERLRSLLAAAFGEDWTSAKEQELLSATAAQNDSRPAASLDAWLRKDFFAEHYKLFHSRPFIWQIWDGNAHGFSALVNYHKLAGANGEGRRTLDLLTYTHLSDWIERQRLEQAQGVNGADDRLAAALDLQGQLKNILAGEPPYDIFVRWKPLHRQPIGWEPDLNDGVRLNIRPFLKATLRRGGRQGAGILRQKPKALKWDKDRGKEPQGAKTKEDYPCFWGGDERDRALTTDFGAPIPNAPPAGSLFDGHRWNILHYTLAAKQAARDRHRAGGGHG